MGYKSLKIQNFRAIERLEITDLKQINLIVGKNNSGKSTILEAFFILSGMSHPKNLESISVFRDFLQLENGIRSIFRDLDTNNKVVLSGKLSNDFREAIISPSFDDENIQNINTKNDTNNKQEVFSSLRHNDSIKGIQIDFSDHKNNKYSTTLRMTDGRINLPKGYKEEFDCLFINSHTIMRDIDKRLDRLLVKKNTDSIINVLQSIEPKLSDIRIGTRGMIYVDIGTDTLMPLNIMGDGMRRLLAILTSITDMKNGLVLVDEPENGFHYTSMKIAWKAIVEACCLYNVQLVATTHSYECIEALTDTLKEDAEHIDNFNLYRVEREGNKHHIKSAGVDTVQTSIEKDLEVR